MPLVQFSGSVLKNPSLRLAVPRSYSIVSQEKQEDSVHQPDKLYKTLLLEVRGNDQAVLKSYQQFTEMAAKELDISVVKTWDLKYNPYKLERYTLLKSVFVYKTHRVQYEIRTYFRFIQIENITGSTADTFLEYIERNLPEGVAMKVTKHELCRLPDYVKPSTSINTESDNRDENK